MIRYNQVKRNESCGRVNKATCNPKKSRVNKSEGVKVWLGCTDLLHDT